MNRIILFLLFGILTSIEAKSQFLPPNQPEQNACKALVICGNEFYTPYTYVGNGSVMDLPNTPCGQPGLSAGEYNSIWLKLTINTPGVIVFNIKPVSAQDDYDWAVLDITNKSCNNLFSSDVIRCNFNNNQPVSNNGITGLSLTATQSSVLAGTTGQPYCKFINATVGQVFLIMINNFGVLGQGLTSGFSINFTGSTATFNNDGNPRFTSIASSCNTKSEVIINLSKPIKCSSIATNGSDFQLAPFGTVQSAQGINCNSNGTGYTNQVKVVFSPNLAPGDYFIKAKVGTDGNTLLDLCNNALQLPDSLPFKVPILKTKVIDTICQNQLPYTWNGLILNSGGNNIATVTLPNETGCDSVITLDLLLVDTIKTTATITICPDALPYVWNGISINNAGNQIANYYTKTTAGCDSLITLNLIVQQPYANTYDLSGCGFVVFNNITYTQSQTNILDTIISSFNCDSVYAVLNILIHPVNPVTNTLDTAGCGFVDYLGERYTDSKTWTDTIANQYGCDSIYNITKIIVYPIEPERITITKSACDRVTFEGKTYDQNLVLIDTFQNILGCDSLIRTVYIHPEHFKLGLAINPEHPVKDVLLILSTSTNVPQYQVTAWKPTELFSNQLAYEQHILADESTSYTVYGKSTLGCSDSATVRVVVDSLIPVSIMPSAFSPNGDGINDIFKPFFVNETGYKIQEFKIFNRYGHVVYTAGGVLNAGWNGNYFNRDKPAEAGVYFYYINVIFVNGKELKMKGDVTLIR